MYYGKKVMIKTGEELISEGYDVRQDGVYRDNKMYLNESDLQYLGWDMEIEYKESIHHSNEAYKGFSLTTPMGYEVDMYSIDPCMFKCICNCTKCGTETFIPWEKHLIKCNNCGQLVEWGSNNGANNTYEGSDTMVNFKFYDAFGDTLLVNDDENHQILSVTIIEDEDDDGNSNEAGFILARDQALKLANAIIKKYSQQ